MLSHSCRIISRELISYACVVRSHYQPVSARRSPAHVAMLTQRALCLLCAGQNELGCEIKGRRLEEGQVFQPSCAQLCRCLGGGLTCVPLCSDDLQKPAEECANPQLVRPPGRCCREWVCDSQDNSISSPPSAGNRF